jgi:hypothetical protein
MVRKKNKNSGSQSLKDWNNKNRGKLWMVGRAWRKIRVVPQNIC